jgi:hypothetical protein
MIALTVVCRIFFCAAEVFLTYLTHTLLSIVVCAMSSVVVSSVEKDSCSDADDDFLISVGTEAEVIDFQSPLTDSQPSTCTALNGFDIDVKIEAPGLLVTDVDASDPVSSRLSK